MCDTVTVNMGRYTVQYHQYGLKRHSHKHSACFVRMPMNKNAPEMLKEAGRVAHAWNLSTFDCKFKTSFCYIVSLGKAYMRPSLTTRIILKDLSLLQGTGCRERKRYLRHRY